MVDCGLELYQELIFTSAEAAAWGGFLSTHGRLTKRLEENLRRTSGLSHAEYEVLLRLFREDEGRLRIEALAAKSVLAHSGTSRLIDRLEGAGLVTLELCPTCSRSYRHPGHADRWFQDSP